LKKVVDTKARVVYPQSSVKTSGEALAIPGGEIFMESFYNKRAVDVIGDAPKAWSAYLAQVCPVGITPFPVMDETARTGP